MVPGLPPDADDPHDPHDLVVLDRSECLKLLDGEVVGRIGVTVGALPAIFPVNFLLVDERIVIRTGWGTKLAAAAGGQVVCFEADRFDPESRTGWSVLVTGRADILRDPVSLARAHELPLVPWVPRSRAQFLVIWAEIITGRRLGPVPASGSDRSGASGASPAADVV